MSAGLYIHIPFCLRKCKYCDFVSFTDMQYVRAYLQALQTEIRLRAGTPAFCVPFDTVFFGGGTPSALSGEDVAAILALLKKSFAICEDAEISMEANPGTLCEEKLKIYREAGINRLSIGLQSADDALLARIGRIHSYADFLKNYEAAKKAGFTNINVDVMYGLPEQSLNAHIDTLKSVCAHAPTHISAYSLILEEGTPLYLENPVLPDEDACYAMHRCTREYLAEQGYARYEISNYARSGFACRHNLHYWNMDEYLGLGLNAHSAWRLGGSWTRFCNTASLQGYIERLAKEELPEEECEPIPQKEEMFEFLMLGLRKTEGISISAFEKRFGCAFHGLYGEALSTLRRRGWLEESGDKLRLNERGLDMQNEALLTFMD